MRLAGVARCGHVGHCPDCFGSCEERRHLARDLGVGVELHYLDTPADELWRRIEARNSEPPWDSYPISRADVDGWLRLFQAPDAAELALFDSPPD